MSGNVENCDFQVAAAYGPIVLLWEGMETATSIRIDRSILGIFHPRDEEWKQVIGDKLYIIELDHPIEVYALDLTSYHWKQLENVGGVPPLPYDISGENHFTSSWVWEDKIYIFGGYGRRPDTLHSVQDQVQFRGYPPGCGFFCCNNQCVAFNTTTEAWEWPRLSGEEMPCPRSDHACIVDGEYMLLFGGDTEQCQYLNDLHALHMPSHTWSKLSAGAAQESEDNPTGRCLHSFTSIGENRAIVLGGYNQGPITDCWLLTWSASISGIENVAWSQWKNQNYGQRCGHRAVYSSDTSRVYLFGGLRTNCGKRHPAILVNPASLFELSMDTIVKHKEKFDCLNLFLPSTIRTSLKKRLGTPAQEADFEPKNAAAPKRACVCL